MGKWRDMAADILAGGVPDEVQAPEPPRASLTPILSQIETGLVKLETSRPPKITQPGVWAEIVEDSRRLIADGWHLQALALGWSLHDLFGVGAAGDWEFEGLAVWLRSRQLVLIDERLAVAIDEQGTAYFNRGGPGHGKQPAVQPVLLWDFGRRG